MSIHNFNVFVPVHDFPIFFLGWNRYFSNACYNPNYFFNAKIEEFLSFFLDISQLGQIFIFYLHV